MADTPKTPAPSRRKAGTTPRKSARNAPPKAAGPATAPAAKPPVKRAAKTPARKPAAKFTATKANTAVKSAAAKVGTTASSAKQTVAQSTPAQFVADTRDMMGDRNFFAALIGGAAAIGAAIGGIFYAMRDGNPDRPAGKDKGGSED